MTRKSAANEQQHTQGNDSPFDDQVNLTFQVIVPPVLFQLRAQIEEQTSVEVQVASKVTDPEQEPSKDNPILVFVSSAEPLDEEAVGAIVAAHEPEPIVSSPASRFPKDLQQTVESLLSGQTLDVEDLSAVLRAIIER